jgi:hypothetical protein
MSSAWTMTGRPSTRSQPFDNGKMTGPRRVPARRDRSSPATSPTAGSASGSMPDRTRRRPVVIAAPPHHGGGVYNHARRTPDDVRHHRPGPLGGRHIRRDGDHRTPYGGGARVGGRDTDWPHPPPPRRRGAGVSKSARVRAPRLDGRDTPRRMQTPRVSVCDTVTPSGVPDLSVGAQVWS